ncbi:TPA: peptide chain release factor 1 [Candidatus Micrarchaeota archaeon]|nr:peptide chain release factor 1 [Candidatus Micrarchaeota archaeon]
MVTSTEQEYAFRKELKRLSSFRGSGTELISVYIPKGSPIHETAGRLREEMSQASNIKSKSTRTNVTGALERILQHFKVYRHTPPHGVAVFCGNVSDNPAKNDLQLFSVEPPQPLSVGAYRCDSKFFLEPLERMIESTDAYGLVVLDGREATIAIMKGTQVQVLKKLNSNAHQKVNKGGQSQRRYERLVEESIEKYHLRVGAAMDMYLLGKVKGVIVGGPGPTKEYFMKANAFNYQFKVLGVVDTGYTDEYGLREIIAKSDSLLAQQEAVKERILVEKFIKEVVKEGLATYGEKQVREAILSRQAETLVVSEGLSYVRTIYKCDSCGNEDSHISTEHEKVLDNKDCTKCGSNTKKTEDMPLIDDLVELAHENNIPVEIVSINTAEGTQFLQGFTGIGAFLRYRTR